MNKIPLPKDKINLVIFKFAHNKCKYPIILMFWAMAFIANSQQLPTNPKDLYDLYQYNKSVENRDIVINALLKNVNTANKLAQYYLGRIYYESGKAEDYEIAFNYLQKSQDGINDSDRGLVNYLLGYMTIEGLGTQKNITKGLDYYEKAANFQNAAAATELARIYLNGKLIAKSIEVALKYFQIATDLKDGNAAYELALMYKNGNGVSVNNKLYNDYLKLAAEYNNENAKIEYGIKIYDANPNECNHDELKKYFEAGTIQQRDDAIFYMAQVILTCNSKTKPDINKALNYLKILAKKNQPTAQILLAKALIEGTKNTPAINPTDGLRILNVFADSGVGAASLLLSKYYNEGNFVAKNKQEATIKFLDAIKNKAANSIEFGIKFIQNISDKKLQTDLLNQLQVLADADVEYANFILGRIYAEGKIVPYNFALANKFLTFCVKTNNELNFTARKLFTEILLKDGPTKNVNLAYKVISVKGVENDSDALYLLGTIFIDKAFAQNDVNKAIKIFTLASENGNAEATQALSEIYLNGINGAGKDELKAIQLLEKAAIEQKESAIQLAKIYWNGSGKLAKNQAKAIEVLLPYFKKQDAEVNFQLAKFYVEKPEIFKININPLQYFKVLADSGNAEAQYQLGLLFAEGEIVNQSIPDAENYFNLALKNGYQEARFALAAIQINSENKSASIQATNILEAQVQNGDALAIYSLANFYYIQNNHEKSFVYATLYKKLFPDVKGNKDENITKILGGSTSIKDKTKINKIIDFVYGQIETKKASGNTRK